MFQTPVDYGSQFDAAYGNDADAGDMPRPPAATTAGLPPAPAYRHSVVGRVLAAGAVVAIAIALAFAATPASRLELPDGRSQVAPADTPLVVLATGGTAGERLLDVAVSAERLGYPVERVAIEPGMAVESPTVMYAGDNGAAARRVADDLGIGSVTELSGLDRTQLGSAQIAVVLGGPKKAGDE